MLRSMEIVEMRVKIEYNKAVVLGAKYGSYPFNPELEIF